MSVVETTNKTTGKKRFYVNGVRVSEDKIDMLKFGRNLDTFNSWNTKNCSHHSYFIRK